MRSRGNRFKPESQSKAKDFVSGRQAQVFLIACEGVKRRDNRKDLRGNEK
jgi:hypothetical protein